MNSVDQAARRAAERVADSMKASYLIGDKWNDLFASIIAAEFKGLAEERDLYKPYYDAVRAAHNGYDPDARKEMVGLKEPATPEEAIRSLLQEAEEISDSAIKAALDERDRLAKDVNELNALLREVGWGQGEIDSAATVAEENDRLRALLKEWRQVADEAKDLTFVPVAKSTDKLLADIDAALKEAK